MKKILESIRIILLKEIILLLTFNTIDIIYPNIICHILTKIQFFIVFMKIVVSILLMIYIFFNNKRKNIKNDKV